MVPTAEDRDGARFWLDGPARLADPSADLPTCASTPAFLHKPLQQRSGP